MLRSFNGSCLAATLCCLFAVGCTNGGEQKFETRSDSLAFARAVMEKYPEVPGRPVMRMQTETSGLASGMKPIPWDTVINYKDYYDKEQVLFDADKKPLNGFMIDPDGYKILLADTAIAGLYLRLGRKPDGSHTIMVMGTDKDGNILTTANPDTTMGLKMGTNFDNLSPCPKDCPKNFDN